MGRGNIFLQKVPVGLPVSEDTLVSEFSKTEAGLVHLHW